MSLEEARTTLLDSVRLCLDSRAQDAASMQRLQQILRQHAGDCPVTAQVQRAGAVALLRLGDDWRVEPADQLLQSLRDQFGKDSVSLHYR